MPRTASSIWWFLAALAPMVLAQFGRIQQTDAQLWLAWDYAGRIGTIAVLAVIPAARTVAFEHVRSRLRLWEIAVWIIGIVVVDQFICELIRWLIDGVLPNTTLGGYPPTAGWLHLFDITFGLALVAVSEELIFRRCARHLLRDFVGDGRLMIIISALMFGTFHWWKGIGSVTAIAALGYVMMLFYRWSKALWPLIAAHYLIDLIHFT